MSIRLDPRRISGAVVLAALAEGWRQLRGCLKPAAGFAAVFVLIGVLILGVMTSGFTFIRIDAYERYATALIYVPRERYNTDLRKRMQDVLLAALNGSGADFWVQFGESVLARVLFTIRTTIRRHCSNTN